MKNHEYLKLIVLMLNYCLIVFCDSDALATNGLSLWGIMIGTGVHLGASSKHLFVDYNTTGEVTRSVFQFFRYGTDWMTPVWMTPVEEVHINNVTLVIHAFYIATRYIVSRKTKTRLK